MKYSLTLLEPDVNSHLPASTEEAFEVFTKPDDSGPKDCHNHCDCYFTDGHCCDCNEDNPNKISHQPIPIKEFIEQQSRDNPVHHMTYGGLLFDYDAI